MQDRAHAGGEPGGQRHAAAGIGRHAGLAFPAAGDGGAARIQRLEAQQLAGEDETVAGDEGREEPFLHLSQHRPAAQLHLDQRGFDDGAEIHPQLPRHRVGPHMDAAIGIAEQFREAVIGPQRVAAILHEAQRIVEIAAREGGIGRGSCHLRVQLIRQEGRGDRTGQDMLAQHIQPAFARRVAIQLMRRDRLARGGAFDDLEAVRRHQHGAARLLQPVVRAADALQQPRDALRRADLHHLIHRAPIDAQIEGGGGDHRAQFPRRHCRFHLAALLHRQAAVMQRDGQVVVIDLPQRLEAELRLGAGVDEDDGDPRLLDPPIDLRHRGEAHMPAPGQATFRQQDIQHRLRPARADDKAHILGPPGAGEEGAQRVRMRNRRRQANAPRAWRERAEPREAQRQLVAALGTGQGVDLIHHHCTEATEQRWRIRQGQQQSERFRRGQQDLRRRGALPGAAIGGGVAGPRLDADGQAHLLHRGGQVARDIHRQRLERRDIQRVQPVLRGRVQVDQARQEAGQRLAAAGRRNQQRARAVPRGIDQRKLMGAGLPAAAGEPGGKRFRQCSHCPPGYGASRGRREDGATARTAYIGAACSPPPIPRPGCA